MLTISTILNNVSFEKSGRKLLNDVSLTLSTNQHLAIIGNNGSGKTLLAKAIMGSINHTGNISFTKNDVAVEPVKAFVPFQLDIHQLVDQNFYYYQQRYNYRDAIDSKTITQYLKGFDPKKVAILLNEFNLSHKSNTALIQLSNGELKKLQIIKELLAQPELLILDTPFTGLDVASRKDLHSIINTIAANGTQIIIITDYKELPACITHFVEIDNGTINNFAPIEKLSYTLVSQHQQFGKLPYMHASYHTGPLISLTNVNVRFGEKKILTKINWQVKPGDCWWIQGHNGAGKSTLLSIITGDNPQAYGQQVYLFGRRRGTGESIWDIKKQIGFVSPELFNFFDKNMTVTNALGSGLFDTIELFQKMTDSEKNIVNEWIAFLGMQNKALLPLEKLSIGEQRLILLTRVLIKSPSLLIFDEPFQGLDAVQCKMMKALIDKIYAQTNTTILLVDHYEENIPACINKKLSLKNGEATIHTKQVKKHYATI